MVRGARKTRNDPAMTRPLMISGKDDDLVGVARRSDPLGFLANLVRPRTGGRPAPY